MTRGNTSTVSPSRARPLQGVTVLVTRAPEQARELSLELEELGAAALEAPAIRLAPPRSWTRVDRAVGELAAGNYMWLVLTSANGVRYLLERLDALGCDRAVLKAIKIAAVGPGTAAALRLHGVKPSLVPSSFTTADIGREFPDGIGRVLLARADLVEPGLDEAIEEHGWTPERVVLYRLLRAPRLAPGIKRAIRDGRIGAVTFASGGTVRAFAKLLGEPLPESVRVAVIGPVTARAAVECGFRVDAVASEHTIPGLAAAAAKAWSSR